jgi:glycosyl-4,4'-diaponeurosporenoate acyltransferase
MTQHNIVLALIDAGVWAAWSALSGYAAHRVSDARLSHDNRLFRVRRFEAGGRFYERVMRIKQWKDLLPDAGALFQGGVSKQDLVGRDREHLAWFFLWNPWWLGLAMVGYGIVANVPCVAIQRYNRARLLRIIRRPSTARTA